MSGFSEVTAYKATDGSLHESPAQAIAVNLTRYISPDGRKTITPEAAWTIIEHRKHIIEMLQNLNPKTDYKHDRPKSTQRGV